MTLFSPVNLEVEQHQICNRNSTAIMHNMERELPQHNAQTRSFLFPLQQLFLQGFKFIKS